MHSGAIGEKPPAISGSYVTSNPAEALGEAKRPHGVSEFFVDFIPTSATIFHGNYKIERFIECRPMVD